MTAGAASGRLLAPLVLALAGGAHPAAAEPMDPARYLAAVAGRTFDWRDDRGALVVRQRFAADARTSTVELPDGSCATLRILAPAPGDDGFCYVALKGPIDDQCWRPSRDAAGFRAVRTDPPGAGLALRASPSAAALCRGAAHTS
ncbi:hypothetical protein BCF33_0530 [Hasllibacter halocynthiae]|uniref:Uncharacterized protein n=1 Tax=Hasllibacter halocynthiae TaxID=595589 RepID=A0A2T0X7M4_9RHOB|nr:hypothetical protein [Hasllibacter halocynthiae]PRY94927.1 hypothetical protein BCF33_0530 [Hasllibacter halocynthiae]